MNIWTFKLPLACLKVATWFSQSSFLHLSTSHDYLKYHGLAGHHQQSGHLVTNASFFDLDFESGIYRTEDV